MVLFEAFSSNIRDSVSDEVAGGYEGDTDPAPRLRDLIEHDAYVSVNTRLPTQVILLSMGILAPTLAKKRVTKRRHHDLFSGTHWVSWLPLKGTRQMTSNGFGEMSSGMDVAHYGIIML